MARLIGPGPAQRTFYYTFGPKKGTLIPDGTPVPLYADVQCSDPADVLGLDGSPIGGTIPTVLIGSTLEAPQFLFPDVVDPVVYTRIAGGPVIALHPDPDARLDALLALLTDLADRANHTGTQDVSTITGLGTAATRNVGTGPTEVVVGSDDRLPSLAGAEDGMSVVYDAASGKLVLRLVGNGPPLTEVVLAAALPNTVVFRSDTYDRNAVSPGKAFSSIRVLIVADAAFTATLQSSSDATTWADQVSFPVVANAVDQIANPAVRYARVVITGAAAGMTSMLAKVVLT